MTPTPTPTTPAAPTLTPTARPTVDTERVREVVLGIVRRRLEERRAQATPAPAPAQRPSPPVQLPRRGEAESTEASNDPIAAGAHQLINFVMAVFESAEPAAQEQGGGCAAIQVDSAVEPSVAEVGQTVTFTYTVANTGDGALADVEAGTALPDGLVFVSASDNGAIDPANGHVLWALPSGLPSGDSVTLMLVARVTATGQLDNRACGAGVGLTDSQIYDCATSLVSVIVPTLTPTPSPTTTPTVLATATPTQAATPTASPGMATPLPAPMVTAGRGDALASAHRSNPAGRGDALASADPNRGTGTRAAASADPNRGAGTDAAARTDP